MNNVHIPDRHIGMSNVYIMLMRSHANKILQKMADNWWVQLTDKW